MLRQKIPISRGERHASAVAFTKIAQNGHHLFVEASKVGDFQSLWWDDVRYHFNGLCYRVWDRCRCSRATLQFSDNKSDEEDVVFSCSQQLAEVYRGIDVYVASNPRTWTRCAFVE